MYHFLKIQKGVASLATILLIAVASVAVIALTYTATQTPTRTTPQAQGGRCFWIEAEFQKRADGQGYDPFVLFKSDDSSGFDDIYLTRDGALVAGPNKWNKTNGPFVFYPQYTGGILRDGETIIYVGRDDNCGTRGNASTIACSVDQNGNLVQTGSCKLRGGVNDQPQPTVAPTQPSTQKTSRMYIEPSTVNPGQQNIIVTATNTENCSTNISNPPDSGGGFTSSCVRTGGFSCSGNTKDTNPCWWQWTCTASQTPATYTVTFTTPLGISCSATAGLIVKQPQVGHPQPTNIPTIIPNPTSIPTPIPTSTPMPAPLGIICGYIDQDCCLGTARPCEDPSLVCGGNICTYPAPTSIPTPTKQVSSHLQNVSPTQVPEIVSQATNLVQEIVDTLAGRQPEQPQQITQTGSITGNVSVNKPTGVEVVETKVALYRDKGEPSALAADARDGTYEYNNLHSQEYFIKAWVKDQNGNWYQNRQCSLFADDYDCVVKPGDNQNLVVDIGSQGFRGVFEQSQAISTGIAKYVKSAVISFPFVGSFFNTFFISAF